MQPTVPAGIYGDYDIYIGDGPITDVPGFLRSTGQLQRGTFAPFSSPKDHLEEERGIAAQDIKNASLIFERTRSQVREALLAIVRYMFQRFKLPKTGGVDFGCGATGEMVEELLPADIDRNSWTQIDMNPRAVEENRRRHPHSNIIQGSYLNTASLGLENQLNIATGLSSLDSTCFIEDAIGQIRETLQAGGYLFHVQDVRPGKGFGLDEMEHMGERLPYRVEICESTGDPLMYRTREGLLSVGELFRRRIGRALWNEPGMELLFNRWVIARRNLTAQERERKEGRAYFMNILFRHPQFNFEEASAVVTIARKRE